MKFFKSEPALLAGVVTAAVPVASAFWLHWEADQVSLVTTLAVAVMALIVRQSVVPTAEVAEKAHQVGTQVAENLDSTTVGAVGAVTGGAKGIIKGAVDAVLGGW